MFTERLSTETQAQELLEVRTGAIWNGSERYIDDDMTMPPLDANDTASRVFGITGGKDLKG